MKKDEIKTIAVNKKAYHDYFIEDRMESGLVLAGTEVKSIRAGGVNLKDCYVTIKGGEAFVSGMHISPYEQGNIFNKDPLRDRKLLLHKKEIMRLQGYTQRDGMALIPLSLYFSKGMVKMELGIARGKKDYDKRDTIAKRDADRDIERRLKNR